MIRFFPNAGFHGGPVTRVSAATKPRGKILSPSVTRSVRSLVSFLAVLILSSSLTAQPAGKAAPTGSAASATEVVLQAYTLRHQRASEAVALVYPLLSRKGTVELQPGGNTLVIRDVPAALNRIVPVLRNFDHQPRPMRLEVLIVRASRNTVSPQVRHSDLPEQLTKRLHDLLAYDNFEMQAQAQLGGVEGQPVIYELGQDYKVSFRFGTLMDDQRVKLSSFRISRRGEGKPETNLLQTNLTLWCDQTISLGLAKSEASREALMVVLTLREGDAPRR
ncbi:MAG TPA: secretin N-terminal domain-containing protein [Thermoanaerobaculia bacterium]|nr:secretin N-terminal domain-containing protein [Thermoanaerobaculia bacterium]